MYEHCKTFCTSDVWRWSNIRIYVMCWSSFKTFTRASLGPPTVSRHWEKKEELDRICWVRNEAHINKIPMWEKFFKAFNSWSIIQKNFATWSDKKTNVFDMLGQPVAGGAFRQHQLTISNENGFSQSALLRHGYMRPQCITELLCAKTTRAMLPGHASIDQAILHRIVVVCSESCMALKQHENICNVLV